MDSLHRLTTFLAQNAMQLAEAEARAIHGRYPDTDLGPVAEAMVMLHKNNAKDAETLLNALRPRENGLPLSLAWLARAQLQQGKVNEARDNALASVQSGDEWPEALLVMGQVCMQLNQPGDAVTWLSRVTAHRPTDVAAWKALAGAHAALKQHAAAAQAIEHALALNKNDPVLWAMLLKARVDNGEVERAQLDMATALKQFPRDPEVMKAANKLRMAQTTTTDPLASEMAAIREVLGDGKLDEAYERFDRINVLPRPSRAMKFLELELRSHLAGLQVTDLYVQAQKLAKDYPHAWEPKAIMADLLMRTSPIRNVKQAATYAEEAWTMSGGHPSAGFWLIRAWVVNGKVPMAQALAGQLRTLGPKVAARVEKALKP